MAPEENKAIVRRFFEEFFNKRDFTVLDEIAATYFIHHNNSETQNLETYKQQVHATRTAFPDCHFTIEDLIAQGDKVITRWTWHGTQTGELIGITPTNMALTCPGITIFQFAEGKIIEMWACWDTAPLR